MKLAIVGAGPSGLAAARTAVRHKASVYIIDKYSRPGGLLRYGVGFWNDELKSLQRKLIKDIADLSEGPRSSHNTQFLPNTSIDSQILDSIAKNVDGVVLAHGGDISYTHSWKGWGSRTVRCQDFVGFYNGAPWVSQAEKIRIQRLLDAEGDVVVHGFGNVALDVITYLTRARLSAMPAVSKFDVHLVGRSDLSDAKWTPAVAREAFRSNTVVYTGEIGTVDHHISKYLVSPKQCETSQIDVYIHDHTSISEEPGGAITLVSPTRPIVTLGKIKLIVNCTGFAQNASILAQSQSLACPTVRVGWCATNCRGDVGAAISSGRQGTQELLKLIATDRQDSVVPYGSARDWKLWDTANC